MDLELSDEQTWLSEAVGTLLDREWRPAPEAPSGTADARDTLWRRLTDFGALAVGADDGLGPVELCVIARALGEHLAPVPYLASAAVRYAVTPSGLPELCGGEDAVALAILEPGSGWGAAPRTTLEDAALSGRKVAVEHLAAADRIAVVAAAPDGPALAVVARPAAGLSAAEQPAFDPTAPMHAVDLAAVAVGEGDVVTGAGAAHAIARLDGDRRPARRRRGRRRRGPPARRRGPLRRRAPPVRPPDRELPGAAPPARRHVRAPGELVVVGAVRRGRARRGRRRGGCGRPSIAKAYVGARRAARSRTARCRSSAGSRSRPSTRRTASCGGSSCATQQFGDAAHHERALGRALAAAAVPEPVAD